MFTLTYQLVYGKHLQAMQIQLILKKKKLSLLLQIKTKRNLYYLLLEAIMTIYINTMKIDLNISI